MKKFWPILTIFLLVVVFAFPYWAKNKVPLPADHLVTAFPPWQYYYGMPVKNNAMPDVVTQMYPFKHLVIGLWKNSQIPLWNPYNFSGNPLLGNYQSAVFHPANFLFFILPEIDAWSLMILLQPLLAGLFTYFFCRQLKLSQVGSLLSAAAFMFCGFMTVWLAYGTMSWALLWLPLVFYAIEKSFEKLTAGSLILISFSLVASFFSGHFQISLYVLLASFAYLVYRLITGRQFKTFLICFLFIILGILLAAIQILPTFELHQLSVRSQTVGVSEIIPWRYWITVLAPDFYGNAVTRNDWFGHYAEWLGFTGVIPLVLTFFAFAGKKKKTVWFFGLLALGALVLTGPTPILDLIVKWKIPVLSSSAAARIVGLFSFGVAVLSGFGLDQLKENLNSQRFRLPLSFLFLIAGLFLSIWGWLLLIKPFPAEKLMIAQRNLILPTGIAFGFIGLLVGFKIFQNLFKEKKLLIRWFRLAILSLILTLAVFDVFRFAQKWMPFDDRAHVYPSLPVLEFLSQRTSPDRVFGYFGMEMQNYYHILGFNGYDPLYVQRYGELLIAANSGKIGLPSTRGVGLERRARYTMNLLNLLGGKYVLHAIPDDRHVWAFNFWDYPDQFKQIYQDDKYEVYENLSTFPRAFIAYDYQVIGESQKIVDQMFSPKTDLRKTVVLEEKPELVASIRLPKNQPKTAIIAYLPNEVKIDVETETPGLLFLSDNYYPGWQALVDGKKTQIYRADYSFRAIVVPAGEHKVLFVYRPSSFFLGQKLSVISFGIILALAIWIKFSTRKP